MRRSIDGPALNRPKREIDEFTSRMWQYIRFKKYKRIGDKLKKIGDLIKSGADVNAHDRNAHRDTALHMAARITDLHDARKIYDFLVMNKAKEYQKNRKNETPRDIYKKRHLSTYDRSRSNTPPGPSINTFHFGRTQYKASGLKNTLHGEIYQLKLLMLFLRRSSKLGYPFQLATEKVAKFDDLVIQYKVDKEFSYRFLQAKHKQDESKTIKYSDLFADGINDEFSLQKYFISFREIKQKHFTNQPKSNMHHKFVDFVIATNIDLDGQLLSCFKEVTTKNDILVVDTQSKKTKLYKVNTDSKKFLEKLKEHLHGSSDINLLAKQLTTYIMTGKRITLQNTLFARYHGALAAENIIDVKAKKFHVDFIADKLRTTDAKKFRDKFMKVFEDELKKSNTRTQTLSHYINSKLPISDGFGNIAGQSLPDNDITDAEIDEFVKHLTFAVNQPNEVELGNVIRNELGDEFNSIDSKNVYNSFQDEILSWMKAKEGIFYTNDDTTEFFRRIKTEILGPIMWNICRLSDSFTGRTDELAELDRAVHRDKGITKRQYITVITGFGGVGKTQLVVKYVNEKIYAKHFDSTIWINAENQNTIEKSFINLAKTNKVNFKTLDIDGKKKPIVDIIREVYQFIGRRRSLWIFDNAGQYENTKDANGGDNIGLSYYLPVNFAHTIEKFPSVIITSRNTDWDGMLAIKLGVMKMDEAKQFLSNSLKLRVHKPKEIEKLARKLNCYPLLLQQAIAHLNKKEAEAKISGEPYSIDMFLKNFDGPWKKVRPFEFADGSVPFVESVYSIIGTSTTDIAHEQHGKKALEILDIMAYLNADNILSSIFPEQNRGQALSLLRKYSLIEEIDVGITSIHRIVQQLIRSNLVDENREEMTLRNAINLIMPDGVNYENIDNAIAVWKHAFEYDGLISEFYDHPNMVNVFLLDAGRYADAYRFSRYSIKSLTRALGDTNINTLTACIRNAQALMRQGKHEKALEVFNVIEQTQEQTPASKLKDKFLLELGDYKVASLKELDRFDEAMAILTDTLNKREILYGIDGDGTLETLNNIAAVITLNGMKNEYGNTPIEILDYIARLQQSRCLTMSKKLHRKTMANIATIYFEHGRQNDAFEMLKTIEQHQMDRNPQHPDTLDLKKAIATYLTRKGDYDEALQKYDDIYNLMLDRYGSNNANTFKIRYHMAAILKNQQKKDEALKMYYEIHAEQVKLGVDDSIIGVTLQHIAELKDPNRPSTSGLTFDNCLPRRQKRSTDKCLFSIDDVRKFSDDVDKPDSMKIDSKKFLQFIRINKDKKQSRQLMELLAKSKWFRMTVKGVYKFMFDRVLDDQGFGRFARNERMLQLTGEIARTPSNSFERIRLRHRLQSAAGRIMLIRGIHGAIVACMEGTKTDCGLSVGGMAWSFTMQPIEYVVIKIVPKATNLAAQAAGKLIPGTMGKATKLIIRLAGIRFGAAIAKTVAQAAGGALDIVSIVREIVYLSGCEKRANTNSSCSEKEIRDSIASLSFSGVSFVTGVGLVAAGLPVVGTAVAFALMVGQGTYSGISNIIEYDDKYDTTYDENWSIFWRSVLMQPMASDLEELIQRTELINKQAKMAWQFLNESPSNVIAYGFGTGERPGYGKILMNTKNADVSQISRVIPKPIEHATMICLPHVGSEAYEKGVTRNVPSAVHYCENAMVIADSRRMKHGDSIILHLENVNSGEIVGSNVLKNTFILFRGKTRIFGGNSTVDRFILRNPYFEGRIIGGTNATNILDLSQSTDFDLVDINFSKHTCLIGHLKIELNKHSVLVDDRIYGPVEFRNYYYIGRVRMRDSVTCFTACKEQEIFIDSGGGISSVQPDTVRNCNKLIISPFTEVTGSMSDYTIYVRTNGYNGTDLHSTIDIERGSVNVIFVENELIGPTTDVIYLAKENALLVKMKFGQNNDNLFTLKILNYRSRTVADYSIYTLIDKHGSNIKVRIPQTDQNVEIKSFELHAGCLLNCSSDNLDSVQAQFRRILNATDDQEVLSTIIDTKTNKKFVYGSQHDDVIYMDVNTVFAHGGSGHDIYAISVTGEKKYYRIDNDADDNRLDVIYMPYVPMLYSIKQCDLHLKVNHTQIHILNYLLDQNRRHIMFMDKNDEAYIPIIQENDNECSESPEVEAILARFIHATPTQNMFVLPAQFDDEGIVIDAIESDLHVYSSKNDLMIVRDEMVPLIIVIEDFFLDRTKWETMTWLLYDNDGFSPYYGLIFGDDEIIDYQEKIDRDHSKVFKEYKINFESSISISHNHINDLDDRVGVLMFDHIEPARIKVAKAGTDLILTDQQTKNKIQIKNWDTEIEHRISMFEFSAEFEPITVRALNRFSLREANDVQSLIDKAAKNYENRNKFIPLADTGTKCLISMNGFFNHNSTYPCIGFPSVEEQIRFTEKYCDGDLLLWFRNDSSTEQVLALLHKYQFDIALNGYAANVSDYCSSKLLHTNSTMVDENLHTDYKTNLATYLLHMAVRDGRIDVVKKLFDGSHVTAKDRDEDGRVPLHLAAKYGKLDITKYLLDKYHYSIKDKDHQGRVPLHYAVEFDNTDVSKYLTNLLADVNIEDNHGKRPVDLASKKHIINAVKQAELDKSLLIACRNDLAKVQSLIAEGANPNAKDSDKRSALHYAAFEGQLAIVKYLLQQNVDINSGDIDNQTPLDQVFKRIIITAGRTPSRFFKAPSVDANLDVANYLIDHNATINNKGQQLKVVLDAAAKKSYSNIQTFIKKMAS